MPNHLKNWLRRILPLSWQEWLRGHLPRHSSRIGKVALLLLLVLFIGYFFSPRFMMDRPHYVEGDVIRQSIVVQEDLLLPDQASTRLKAEEILKQQGLIYDFDPHLKEETVVRIQQIFQDTRKRFQKVAEQRKILERAGRRLGVEYFQLRLERESLSKRREFYEDYLVILQKRLADQNQDSLEGAALLEKNKNEWDLVQVQKQLAELSAQTKINRTRLLEQQNHLNSDRQENLGLINEIESEEEALLQDFLDATKLPMSTQELRDISFAFYSEEIETELITLLSGLLDLQILANKKDWKVERHQNFTIRNLQTQAVVNYVGVNDFYDLEEVAVLLSERSKMSFEAEANNQKRNFVIALGRQMLQPTITENKAERETRKAEAYKQISPVYFSVKKGEIIARAGDRATAQQAELIQAYYEAYLGAERWPRYVAVHLFVLALLLVVYYGFQHSVRHLNDKELWIVASGIVLAILSVKAVMVLGEMLEMRYQDFQQGYFRFLYPVVLVSMLVGILVGFTAGLMSGLLVGIFVGLMVQGSLYYFVYCLLASLVAALPIRHFVSRYSVFWHGIKVSALSVFLVALILLIEPESGVAEWLPHLTAAFFSGLLSAALVSILLPLYENLLDVTTNLKLLELSNLNHPALQDLIHHASGSFHHSVLVGNLAEAGAKRIGANPLLARVGAYYHDVGKGQAPQYYYENKPAGVKNIHDEMDPTESARKIIAHIPNGVQLAKKHRLGKAITDILEQHHGTGLVKYFYDKAKKQAQNPDEISEENFRYPGPKPQTPEAAVVMLADMAEAATRSIAVPTPQNIQEMVERLAWAAMEDGQLDESGLDLYEVNLIITEFAKLLCSLHHSRIEYPEQHGHRPHAHGGEGA